MIIFDYMFIVNTIFTLCNTKVLIDIRFCELLLHKIIDLWYIVIMNTDQLVATGLNEQQATAYAMLLEHGELAPPIAAKQLKLTRSNAYKVLDKLTEIGLAKKYEKAKKISYSPANPMALSNLVAEQRNLAAKQEEAVNAVLSNLLAKYHAHTEQPSVNVVSGRENVANAYRAQIQQLQPIYFIRSRADITSMGFDTMNEIRITPGRNGVKRYGITPDGGTGTTSTNGYKRSNMERTWARQEDYDSPVEWSVSGSSLLIVLFGAEPHAITITNPVVADAFRQMWCLLNNCLQAMPYYKKLPR